MLAREKTHARVAIALVILLTTACSSVQAKTPHLSVAAVWVGSEREAFMNVVDAFTAKTKIAVSYESMRQDLGPQLRTRVSQSNPPDVALDPRPGEVAEFARAGNLVDLSQFISADELAANFGRAYIDLGKVDGKQVGIVFKANSKSTFWYNPASFEALGVEPPRTLNELFGIADKYKEAGRAPFAVGGKDGWVLTDYQENLFARLVDARTYNDLYVSHEVAWTDPRVKQSLALLAKFFQAGYQPDGPRAVLNTSFVDSIGQVFGPNPGAEMLYEGGFVGFIAMTGVNKRLEPNRNIDFFPFPQVDSRRGYPIVGGGDIAIMFKDSPEAGAFMQFLASKEAAEILAAANVISPNKQLDANTFPNPLTRKEYEQLRNAQTFLFDGSDLAPSPLGGDYEFIELQKLVQHPDDVETVAQELEKFARTLY